MVSVRLPVCPQGHRAGAVQSASHEAQGGGVTNIQGLSRARGASAGLVMLVIIKIGFRFFGHILNKK